MFQGAANKFRFWKFKYVGGAANGYKGNDCFWSVSDWTFSPHTENYRPQIGTAAEIEAAR